MSVSKIHDLVRDGTITPSDAADLLQLRRELDRSRRWRRVTWSVLVAWFVVLVAIILLAGCTHVVERRVVVRVDPDPPARCLVQKPPAPISSDATAAQKADGYDELERWVRLVVVPSCLEP